MIFKTQTVVYQKLISTFMAVKRLLLYSFFILWTAIACGQNQTNWWFFGNNAGLDFNSGAPVPNNSGQLSTDEGCAAIADACGALLFYTDGITVWNRNHTIMPNGSDLLGDPSSTQSALIIPQPDVDNVYYIFTVGDFNPINGLNYTVVDMTLDNGLGDVVPAQKNINLIGDSAEKIAAAVADNGDAWIVTYAQASLNSAIFNTFYAFRLTSSGMDLSATTSTTFNNVQADDRRGYLKISPDGSKLAMMTQLTVAPTIVNQTGRGAWLFDFNNSNGTVSNATRLQFPATHQAYGAEFSPDSRKLYIDTNTVDNGLDGDRELLQYDLDAPNFLNNPVSIYATDGNDPSDDVARGALQIGPDNKIYYARKSTQWLSVIDDPNQIGAASNFILDGVQVTAGTQVNQGLPPFYNAFFNPSFSFEEACQNNTSQFFADGIANCPGSSVLWNFGDPASGSNNTSSLVNATHVYNTAGTFTVNLSITTARGVYTTNKDITIVPAPVINPVNDIRICDDSSNDGMELIDFTPILTAAIGAQAITDFKVTLHETLNDAQNDFNALPITYNAISASYYLRIDSRFSNGCFETAAFNVNIHQLPIINPIDDLYACDVANDGLENFDLDLAGQQALGSQNPVLFDISYYTSMANATAGSNPINPFYDSTAAMETIWIRIENVENTNCFAIDLFTINLIEQPVINLPDAIELCDDNSNNGTEIFDLTTRNDQIIGSQPTSFNISYHSSMNDADLNLNSISSTLSTGSTTIWVRLENNQQINCYDIAPLQLTVLPHPVVQLPQDILKCANEPITITATAGFNAYLWNTNQTTRSIEVTAAGDYSVTVTNDNGCTASAAITVSNYEPTVITNLAVTQFTIRDNSIQVSVSGSGPWEYSIDDFFYQSSPLFTDLLPGFYTLYVRSINGCDRLTTAATIIAAPLFFTPNQDGFNDYWQVIAIETEPDAKIYIFDRYGKLLKQIAPTGPGWDGTYNGNPLPSSDYWFRVELSDGQMFRGHFSLKR